MESFKLHAPFKPSGDQPEAIESLVSSIKSGAKDQVLMGVTGSGKTFTLANVIEQCNKPTLILSHNKTLAAQLYTEFKEFFPENSVEYFVSYYDYYQPEAYIPQSDTFIEKDASINDEIDKLRLRATCSLIERRDVIIISSISCIYGLGNPENYSALSVHAKVGDILEPKKLLKKLVDINYSRNDTSPERGTFRLRGDTVEISPAYLDTIIRIEFFGNEIERISEVDQLTRKTLFVKDKAFIYPATHFVASMDTVLDACGKIEHELEDRLKYYEKENKLVEAQRLKSRTEFDVEMLKEMGYCSGVENYSRIMDGRKPGEIPSTLLDYFPDDYLLFIDESHVTIPQIKAMYNGDRARKEKLVEYGFRLPCAFDNRPLKFDEFFAKDKKTIFVSATPGDFEIEKSEGIVVEQMLRPTGLLDPKITILPLENQVDSLLEESRKTVKEGWRVLVTTLTKKMAEDLQTYMNKAGLRSRYLHSEVQTFERAEIINSLRKKEFDILIGVNLLREGLDLPEVALVAVLDADKEGFLRSRRSLIQTMGRAARNSEGKVILYADKKTDSIKESINETTRRRKIQNEYNKANNIHPKTIVRKISDTFKGMTKKDGKGKIKEAWEKEINLEALHDLMNIAASNLEFEQAAKIRDKIKKIEENKKIA